MCHVKGFILSSLQYCVLSQISVGIICISKDLLAPKAKSRTLLRYSYEFLYKTSLCLNSAYPTPAPHPCCHTSSSNSSQCSEYTALYLRCSQTDRDKCNCGLRFGWVFKRKHSLSTSLSVCQQGPFVFQPVCACRLCLSATVCGKSGSHETKMGHMDPNTDKSQTTIGLSGLGMVRMLRWAPTAATNVNKSFV